MHSGLEAATVTEQENNPCLKEDALG